MWFRLLVSLDQNIFTRTPIKLLAIDGTESKVVYKSANCIDYHQCFRVPNGALVVGSKHFKWNRKATSKLRNEKLWRDSCFPASAQISESGIVVKPDKGRKPNVTACAGSIMRVMESYFYVYYDISYARREHVYISSHKDFLELFEAYHLGDQEDIRLDEIRKVGDRGM